MKTIRVDVVVPDDFDETNPDLLNDLGYWAHEYTVVPPHTCPTCGSKGFGVSVLGPTRCTFCDGTEGGVHAT